MRQNDSSNIYLIGPMGAGKTTVGQRLAEQFGKRFYDLDAEIEKNIGSPIVSIFAEKGENRFRDYESAQLKQLCALQNIVLSTGGGVVLAPENRKMLSTTGQVLYLYVSAQEQMRRLAFDAQRETRPLLKKYNTPQKLAHLTHARQGYYQEIMDFYYETDLKNPDTLVKSIAADLSLSKSGTAQLKIERTRLWVKTTNDPYPLYIGANLLNESELLHSLIRGKQIMIVSNATVAQHYLQPLKNIYPNFQCDHHLLPDGEHYKNIDQWQHILNALIQQKHHRDTTVLALGGGVIGDIAGFAAACYQRGVDFIQMPTSLLAQVDAAIGGKTAINHPAGKNLIGAFHQPKAVVIDINTLNTLSERDYRAGLSEIIKAALIGDKDFFCELERDLPKILDRDPIVLQRIITQACQIKATLVAADEKETAERILLNLGHTFAHAIEQHLGFGHWLHGEAVAVGLCAAARLSHYQGLITATSVARIQALLEQIPLPTQLPPGTCPDELLSAMSMDKKIRDQQLHFVLLHEIGKACVSHDISMPEVRRVLQEIS